MRSTTYDKRQRAGMCVNCGKEPAKPTSVLGVNCTEKMRINGLVWRAARRSAGKCIKCNRRAVTANHCRRHQQEHNRACLAAYRARARPR